MSIQADWEEAARVSATVTTLEWFQPLRWLGWVTGCSNKASGKDKDQVWDTLELGIME